MMMIHSFVSGWEDLVTPKRSNYRLKIKVLDLHAIDYGTGTAHK